MADNQDREQSMAMRLAESFAGLGPLFMRAMGARLRGGEMSYARVRLLGALQCKHPQIMSSLSEQLGVTPRNVTALVDALEQEGLVERRPHPTDRRATLIDLTPHGSRTWDNLHLAHLAAASEIFDGLSANDQQQLLRLLDKLRLTLQHDISSDDVAPKE